jgi:hypothetical protein
LPTSTWVLTCSLAAARSRVLLLIFFKKWYMEGSAGKLGS